MTKPNYSVSHTHCAKVIETQVTWWKYQEYGSYQGRNFNIVTTATNRILELLHNVFAYLPARSPIWKIKHL